MELHKDPLWVPAPPSPHLPGAFQVGAARCAPGGPPGVWQVCEIPSISKGAWMVRRRTPSGHHLERAAKQALHRPPPHSLRTPSSRCKQAKTPPILHHDTCRQARTTLHTKELCRGPPPGGRRHRLARTRPPLRATPRQQPQWAQMKDRQER